MSIITLRSNSFVLLGASVRDNRQRITDLAEEASLHGNAEICSKARSDLTNPRIRLAIEISWLPGVSPKKALQLLDLLNQDPMSIRKNLDLPTLAHINLMVAAFAVIGTNNDSEDIAEFIQEIAYLSENLSVDEIIRDINEDRTVSDFPLVKVGEQIETELAERKRYFRNVIKDALNRLFPSSLIRTITSVVDCTTDGGNKHAPELIDMLVDSYEIEINDFLQKEAGNVYKLIEAVKDFVNSSESVVDSLVEKIEAVARNWDMVAQPIQLSAKSRGIDHETSNELAYAIRNLAIELYNKHGMLDQSQRLTSLIQELFAELPEVVNRTDDDARKLDEIYQKRKEDEAQRKKWAQEITYHVEIGMMFKNTLSISPEGVSWRNHHYPLKAITRVRWGNTLHSSDGILAGGPFLLAFGDSQSEAIVELKQEEIYLTFIDKLWRAVGFRLLTELLEALKSGERVFSGRAIVRDENIVFTKHDSDTLVDCSWNHVRIWSENGSFCIGSKDDREAYVMLSYVYNSNVHILEQAIRIAFKKTGMRKLSDVL